MENKTIYLSTGAAGKRRTGECYILGNEGWLVEEGYRKGQPA